MPSHDELLALLFTAKQSLRLKVQAREDALACAADPTALITAEDYRQIATSLAFQIAQLKAIIAKLEALKS